MKVTGGENEPHLWREEVDAACEGALQGEVLVDAEAHNLIVEVSLGDLGFLDWKEE